MTTSIEIPYTLTFTEAMDLISQLLPDTEDVIKKMQLHSILRVYGNTQYERGIDTGSNIVKEVWNLPNPPNQVASWNPAKSISLTTKPAA